MPKSVFFRIAQAGATTDGREIQASWIDQMAKNYDPQKYTARVNIEHYRGILPDGPFKMYGDVLALKAETIDGKRTLLAQIDPTPELIALNKARQKLFSSAEIDPNFASTGEAYLVGLAVTDSPASLGTEMLKFAAGLGEQSPFAMRKQKAENLFTAAEGFALELEAEAGDGIRSVIDKLTGLFKQTAKHSQQTESDTAQALEAVADHLKTVEQRFDEVTELRKTVSDLTATINASQQKLSETVAQFSSLRESLDQTPSGTRRPTASGGDASGRLQTDC